VKAPATLMPAIIIKEKNHDSRLIERDKKKSHSKNMRKISANTPFNSAWMKNIKSRSLEHPEGKPEIRYGKYRRLYGWDGIGLKLLKGEE
jgi:hypothetical protein